MKQHLYYTTGQKRKDLEASSNTCLVDIGTDCAIAFEEEVEVLPVTRSRATTKGGKRGKGKGKAPVLPPTSPSKTFWLGRVCGMRQKYGKAWDRTRVPVDLLDRPTQLQGGTFCEFQFNWYKPLNASMIYFSYDVTDLQWISIDEVISIVTLERVEGDHMVYILDSHDKIVIDEFLKELE